MRWPVNSPIMQNYSPRHCWNLPFRTNRATTYETPITARIEAWAGVGLHARITPRWLRVPSRSVPPPSAPSLVRERSRPEFCVSRKKRVKRSLKYLYSLHFCDAKFDPIASTMARIKLKEMLQKKDKNRQYISKCTIADFTCLLQL